MQARRLAQQRIARQRDDATSCAVRERCYRKRNAHPIPTRCMSLSVSVLVLFRVTAHLTIATKYLL